MNCRQILRKAQTLLDQDHYAQAVQVAGSVLENVLVELYHDLLRRVSHKRQQEFLEVQERVAQYHPNDQLTLGRLVGGYRVSNVTEDLEQVLGHSLVYLNLHTLEQLVEVRNSAVHEESEPSRAEAALIVNQVELILDETGHLPKVAPAVRGNEGGLSRWWHTAMPHHDIRENRLDLKIFAVDLAQVVAGGAVPEYQDAETFCRRHLPQGPARHPQGRAAPSGGLWYHAEGQPQLRMPGNRIKSFRELS